MGPVYMLPLRAHACLCTCTGGLKLIRTFPAAQIFNFQCTAWGISRSYATSFGNFSHSSVSFSGIGLSSITLHDQDSSQNSRGSWKARAGSTNTFDGVCFSETSSRIAETVASREKSTMAEDNAEDEEVRDRKGRVIIIAGPTGVGKTRLALALAKRLGGEIISADSVQVCANFLFLPLLLLLILPYLIVY